MTPFTGHVPRLPSTIESIGSPFAPLDIGVAVPSVATAPAAHAGAVVPAVLLVLWSTLDQLHDMFQTMLADRFRLQFHRETREISAYVLTIDKPGSKLKVNDRPDPFDFPIKPAPGRRAIGPGGILLKMVGARVPMSYFTWNLSQWLDNVPVVDRTGLDRFYDFKLEWLQDLPPGFAGRGGAESAAAPVDGAVDGPTLSDALREQLGLKLERRKAPAEVFVIDRVEKPEAN